MPSRQLLALDAHIDERPGLGEVSPLGAWLHIAAMLYARRNLTDGFIPRRQVETLVNWQGVRMLRTDIGGRDSEVYAPVDPFILALELCRRGMWRRIGNHGFAIVGYLIDNPSRLEEAAERNSWRRLVADRNKMLRRAIEADRVAAEEAESDIVSSSSAFLDGANPQVYAKGPTSSGKDEVPASSPRTSSLVTEQDLRGAPLPPYPPSPRIPPFSVPGDVSDAALSPPSEAASPESPDRPATRAAERLSAADKNKVARFFDAVKALDPKLKVLMDGRNAKAIADSDEAPEYIAEAYVAARKRQWGSNWMFENMSIWLVISRLDAYEMWKRGADDDEPGPGRGPVPPADSAARAAAARRFRG